MFSDMGTGSLALLSCFVILCRQARDMAFCRIVFFPEYVQELQFVFGCKTDFFPSKTIKKI